MYRRIWLLYCVLFLSNGLLRTTHGRNITCWELPCKQNRYHFDCCIRQLEIDDGTTIESANFAKQQYLLLEDSNIFTVSPQLFQLMTDVKMLEITGGFVPWVYLRPSITVLNISDSQTKQLVIDPNERKYRLIWLEVRNVTMKEIPPNLNQLRDLEHIGLVSAGLEYLLMDQFDGLNKLEELNLSNNNIAQIYVNFPMRLPALRTLQLGNNELTSINLSYWHMPELNSFDLSSNRLRYIANYNSYQFEKLCAIKAQGNRWNCKWLGEFLHACFNFEGYGISERQGECDEELEWKRNCCYGNETALIYQEYLKETQMN
ncbi:leucine-rich repeat transmembrane neuronal protein 1-like [Toxorhynchites rutilus septentrionalis]|uniref:leucine-rich repeat transmembrane neuronal protein 1-like n=1 Tax=Toxorhynchites rutilus septentrionalis TaxID=329112 RepID=UPI00247B18AA|nr:leucine-rich repeat transmembrane neuronal protein 1-like [Toxorhynchites rutilus septentrionalis]